MDHSQLIADLPKIEKLTAAERLKIARDRRAVQLRIFDQYDREFSSKSNKHLANQRVKHARGKNRNIRFVHSVMLLEAAARNDIDEVRRLLVQGVSPDSTNEDGLTALHQCCIDDSESMMKLLLEFGANVNAEDSEKWTPLHAAATCGHLHLVKYLISKNANLLAVNADGNMPYDICEDEPTLDYIESEMARRGVTQELIDQTRASTERQMLADLKKMAAKGEGLESRDHVGATPLHVASANGYLSVVEFLLDQHAATDLKDNDGWQPIHAAACWGHLEVLELLVQNGADLNAQTKNHETPFDICEDPELKTRIATLRTEQEIRARADHQKNRRPQSSSANTRTHSIRRNSTRDKGLTSKKQIKNEAIIGIQIDDGESTPAAAKNSSTEARTGDALERDGQAEVDAGDRLAPSSANSGGVAGGNKRLAPPPPGAKHAENGNVAGETRSGGAAGGDSNGHGLAAPAPAAPAAPAPAAPTTPILAKDPSAKIKGGLGGQSGSTARSQPVSSLTKFQGETAELVGSGKSGNSCCVLS